jgi:hypothetical protein
MAGQSQAVHSGEPSVAIRRASAADAEVCGRICFEAFRALANRHHLVGGWRVTRGGEKKEPREISLYAGRHVCRSKREGKSVGLLRSK